MTLTAPPPMTGKRKRESEPTADSSRTTIHVTIGSYERALHGFAASLADPPSADDDGEGAQFSDLFLLNAHASSIRCLALSPASGTKRILATGSSDERINLYQISTIAPAGPSPANKKSDANGARASAPLLSMPSTTASSAAQRNRELGSLMHHAATVTAVAFPSHAKLLTAAHDNTLSVLRTRDWTHLATMRAPAPKPRGRPDGDTAGPGEAPAGVADVAVHPSQRLAVSVGLGERCMRLWNLVGGKKAGVLVFDTRMLDLLGEPRKSIRAGEGKRIVWREDGHEFAVAFEKGVAVFSLECEPKAVIALGLREKVSQIQYVPDPPQGDGTAAAPPSTIAVSTEGGDLLFFSGAAHPAPAASSGTSYESGIEKLRPVARISSPTTSGPRSRIKDFQILADPRQPQTYCVIAGSSDGAVRIWRLDSGAFQTPNGADEVEKGDAQTVPAVGTLLGTYETGKRITCLTAFVMDGAQGGEDGAADEVGRVPGFSSDSDSNDESGEDSDELSEDEEAADGEAQGSGGSEESEGENEDEFGGFDDA